MPVVAAVLTVCGAVAAPAAAAPASGDDVWFAGYNGPDNSGDHGQATAVTPDGTGVVVDAYASNGTGVDYFTIMYNAATGAQEWAVRFGTAMSDQPMAIAVSPDGDSVYVTGWSGPTGDPDFLTVASTGTPVRSGRRRASAEVPMATTGRIPSP